VHVVSSSAHALHAPDVELVYGDLTAAHEVPRRIDVILDALRADERFVLGDAKEHGRAPIEAVHDRGLVDFLETAWVEAHDTVGERLVPDTFVHPGLRAGMGATPLPEDPAAQLGYWCFETMTPVLDGTYAAARSAVDAALTATDLVLDGARAAYAACRPPGHHAATAVFGGYCYFNNAAVAAQHAVGTGAARVAVLDVDYHHGNGTEQIFYARGDVLYVSLHGDPNRAYPYFTGFAAETGAGSGAGATLNVPLPAGCDDARFLLELEHALDAVAAFAPELLVVSLGVDTVADDPLSDLAVTPAAMSATGRRVGALDLPTVVVQEGGYHLPTLGTLVRDWLASFGAAE
jgi:acetoin utilization deacetylase AcuC-like enzyme